MLLSVFVKCIKTVFICCEPVFDHISVYCLCAIVKIIGYHYIRKFVYQVTILRQSFITLINFRFFVASICFQINRRSSCDKSIYNILTLFFLVSVQFPPAQEQLQTYRLSLLYEHPKALSYSPVAYISVRKWQPLSSAHHI